MALSKSKLHTLIIQEKYTLQLVLGVFSDLHINFAKMKNRSVYTARENTVVFI